MSCLKWEETSINISWAVITDLYRYTDIFMLYIMTSLWVLYTPNADRNLHFIIFSAKNLKNEKKIEAKFSKIM